MQGTLSQWRVTGASDAEPTDSVFWWLVRLRWVALAGVALVILLAGPVLRSLPAESSSWLWGVAVALLAYNATLAVLGPRRGTRLGHFQAQIVVDCLALAMLVHFAGGIENPFLPLFVLHVVNANIVLGRRAATFSLGVAIALVAVVVLGEGSGALAHHCLHAGGPSCTGTTLSLWTWAVFGGLVLTLVASSLFAGSLTARLRESQLQLVKSVDHLHAEKQRLAATRSAIEHERSKLQAIIDCMGDAVIFSSPDGQVLLSNERALELWGSSGSTQDDDGPTPFQSLGELFDDLGDSTTPYTRPPFERDGRTFEATYSVVRNHRDEALGLVMVARDITDRQAMESHLMHEERMSVVGKLAAAVAHEINNPIGVVSLYSQHALAKLPAESPIRGHLETVLRNADACRKITGDLLTLARPRKPERRPVNLQRLCDEVAQSVKPLAESAGVRVSSGTGDAPVWAPGDADQLQQAMLNLTLNAIEAAGEGDSVSIHARETYGADRAARVIEISDTGAGIAPDRIKKIFQPFFTTKATGTGLGLAVADNIVKSHGGRIDVESVPGRETTFRIVLPERQRGAPVEDPEVADRAFAAEEIGA